MIAVFETRDFSITYSDEDRVIAECGMRNAE
jgi:hypothetical protein